VHIFPLESDIFWGLLADH